MLVSLNYLLTYANGSYTIRLVDGKGVENMIKREKEDYKNRITIVCEKLNITEEQYNEFRNYAKLLHKIYEQQCTGFPDENGNWDTVAEAQALAQEEKYTKLIEEKAKELQLFLFLQADPRGATLYLSREKIENNNYDRWGSECIY